MKQIKILVALFSSLLAFTSVKAGEMTVSGTMQATYQSEQDGTTGNPLGLNTDLSFSGSTDVLSATTVTWKLGTDGTFMGDSGADHTLKFANDYGTFKIGNAGDSANDVDDITPSAFEEANGSGSGTYTAADVGSGLEGSMSVGFAKSDLMGSGVSVDLTYYPKLDGKLNNEKGASGDAGSGAKSAKSANVKIDMGKVPYLAGADGLVITAGYAHSSSTADNLQNKEDGTIAANYSYGPIKVGYQKKAYAPVATAATTKDFYKDDIIGIAYAVNDSLAISYNEIESERHQQGANSKQSTKAINVAYTVGGLTIGFQDAQTDDAAYVKDATDDTRTISLKTAF